MQLLGLGGPSVPDDKSTAFWARGRGRTFKDLASDGGISRTHRRAASGQCHSGTPPLSWDCSRPLRRQHHSFTVPLGAHDHFHNNQHVLLCFGP